MILNEKKTLAATLLAIAMICATPALNGAEETRYEPISHYTVKDMLGWKVHVHNALLPESEHAEVGAGVSTLYFASSEERETLEKRNPILMKKLQKNGGEPKAFMDAPPLEPKSVNLFNGKDLTGWHIDVPKMDKDPNAKNPFIVRDGMLVSLGKPNGHVITDAIHQNYRLEVQYRFSAKPGNCGVLVHASTPRSLYGMFPKSIEVQMFHKNAGDFWCIAEDITVPDMVKRRGPKEKWGTTEKFSRRILNLTDGSEKPVGEWNTMIIECLGDAVKVWVNGDLVNHGTGCTAQKGQIALQAEGSEVEFRKLQLTPITSLTDKD